MRSPLAVLALLVAVLAAGFPRYRCAPAEAGCVAATVFVGSHAHEPNAAAPCCGDPDCDGEDPDAPPAPGDEHGPSCCDHSASDASMSASRVVLVPPPLREVDEAPSAPVRTCRAQAEAFDAPVPRSPTETVVLLR